MSEIPIAEVAHELVVPIAGRRLTASHFRGLADVPPELENHPNMRRLLRFISHKRYTAEWSAAR